jgi:hypothetical protein
MAGRALTLMAAAAVTTAAGGTALHAALRGAGHAPKVGRHWPYTVEATAAGKAVRARLTVQIVDPTGTAHPVQFGATTKYVRNWPIKGVFRDYIIFPRESRGIPLVLRATVVARQGRKVVRYGVTPR